MLMSRSHKRTLLMNTWEVKTRDLQNRMFVHVLKLLLTNLIEKCKRDLGASMSLKRKMHYDQHFVENFNDLGMEQNQKLDL